MLFSKLVVYYIIKDGFVFDFMLNGAEFKICGVIR